MSEKSFGRGGVERLAWGQMGGRLSATRLLKWVR